MIFFIWDEKLLLTIVNMFVPSTSFFVIGMGRCIIDMNLGQPSLGPSSIGHPRVKKTGLKQILDIQRFQT